MSCNNLPCKRTQQLYVAGRSASKFKQYPSGKGLSLIEILISLALMGVILVSLIQLILAGHFAIRQEREIINATNLATEQMDKIKTYYKAMEVPDSLPSKVYDGATGLHDPVDFPPAPYPSSIIEGVTYTLTIETKYPVTCPEIRHVYVTVYWESRSVFSIEKGGSTEQIKRSVTLVNILSEE